MAIFKDQNSKLSSLKEHPFASEREMQTLVEKNLDELFGLRFVASEFAPRDDLRIDTLAFDTEQKSFVIIEYKKSSNWSVIDQGFSYLSLLLDRKDAFVLALNNNYNKNFSLHDINWSVSRVIFLAPSFTVYQMGALGFQDIAFELYQLRKYSDSIISIEQIQMGNKRGRLSEVQTTSEETKRVQREVKKISIEDHFPPSKVKSRELFDDFTIRLLELDSRFTINPVQTYIGIRIERKNVFGIFANRTDLKLHIVRFRPKDLKDPENKVRYLENSVRHFNVHISEMRIKNKEDIDYAIMIARQVIKKYP